MTSVTYIQVAYATKFAKKSVSYLLVTYNLKLQVMNTQYCYHILYLITKLLIKGLEKGPTFFFRFNIGIYFKAQSIYYKILIIETKKKL